MARQYSVSCFSMYFAASTVAYQHHNIGSEGHQNLQRIVDNAIEDYRSGKFVNHANLVQESAHAQKHRVRQHQQPAPAGAATAAAPTGSWVPDDEDFWKGLDTTFQKFSDHWGKRLKCKDDANPTKCENSLIKWALRPEANAWKATFQEAERQSLTHLKTELTTMVPALRAQTDATISAQINQATGAQIQSLLKPIKENSLAMVRAQVLQTDLQCTPEEKAEIEASALAQFEDWWANNSEGLTAQLAAGSEQNIGGSLNKIVQSRAAAFIREQITNHHTVLGHVLNQMRKDVRNDFKNMERELWVKQALQWKQTFLSSLTDRMNTAVNLMNEYFVTNQLPANLNAEISTIIGQVLSGDDLKQQATQVAQNHLARVVTKSVDFAKAKVLNKAHAEALKKLAANWQ